MVLTANNEKEKTVTDPTVPVCDNYLASTKIVDLFKVTSSDNCEGSTFVIKSMRSDNFESTDMEGFRPVFSSELQGDASDSSTLIYALNQYLNSAE